MSKARVLVVEDEPFIRELLLEVFEEAALDVSEAGSGAEAIDLLENSAQFDILLTDIHMPGQFDGIAVALRARERQPYLPVVFATGRPEALRAFGQLTPREACLAKPFTASEALTIVKRLLREKMKRDHAPNGVVEPRGVEPLTS